MKKLLIALLFVGSSIANASSLDNVDAGALGKTLKLGSKIDAIVKSLEIKKVISAPITSSCEKTLIDRGYSQKIFHYGQGFEGVLLYEKFSLSGVVGLHQFQKEMKVLDIKPPKNILEQYTPTYIKNDTLIVCAFPMYDMKVEDGYIMYVMSKSEIDRAVMDILKLGQSLESERETKRADSFDTMNSELDSLN